MRDGYVAVGEPDATTVAACARAGPAQPVSAIKPATATRTAERRPPMVTAISVFSRPRPTHNTNENGFH
jgi:hypothetical protein